MSGPWRIEEPPSDNLVGAPPSLLASVGFLRAALRRRWRTCAALGCIGLLLGMAYSARVAPNSEATVTVVLAHAPETNPAEEMLTDLSLLHTNAVAQRAIEALGRDMAPEEFQDTFVAETPTPTVLRLTVAGADDGAALHAASTLVDTYLSFRAEQFRTQAEAQTSGDRKQVAALQREVDQLTEEFDANSTGTPAQQSAAQAALAKSSQVSDRIDELQQSIDTTMTTVESVTGGSRVIDEPAIVPASAVRHLVLSGASGLIGGTALGGGLVIFSALTSNRLRRREEVALAIGAPVRSAVERLHPRRLPSLRRRARRRSAGETHGLHVLAHGLEAAFEHADRIPARMVLATLDNEADGVQVAAAVGVRLTGSRRSAFMVDLSVGGRLEEAVEHSLRGQQGSSIAPDVFRPHGVPALARGPLAAIGSTSELREDDPLRAGWDAADFVLTLAPVDLNTGADELASWGEHAVLLVTAGRSSADQLRTAADLLRRSGLELLFALMIGADRTDESLGRVAEHDTDVDARMASS